MQRYLLTTFRFWSASVAAEMEYRANFVMTAIQSVMTLVGSVFTLGLFYQHDYTLGGWSWPQALILISVYTLLDGFQGMLLVPNRTRVTELVREGTLDFVLLKPIDTQYWLSARQLSIWGAPNVVFGLGLMIYAMFQLDTFPEIDDLLLGAVAIALGMVVLYSLGFILGTLTIWFVKLFNVTMAMQALLEAGRYPIPAYPLAYRIFFTFILPVAFMTTVPARTIIGPNATANPTDTPGPLTVWFLGSFVVAFALLFISRKFWQFALRYYTSASS